MKRIIGVFSLIVLALAAACNNSALEPIDITPPGNQTVFLNLTASYAGNGYTPVVGAELVDEIEQITFWVYDGSSGRLVYKEVQDASTAGNSFGQLSTELRQGNYHITIYGVQKKDVFQSFDSGNFSDNNRSSAALQFLSYSSGDEHGDVLFYNRLISLTNHHTGEAPMNRQNTQVKIVLEGDIDTKITKVTATVQEHNSMIVLTSSSLHTSADEHQYDAVHELDLNSVRTSTGEISSLFSLLSNSSHSVVLNAYDAAGKVLKTDETAVPLRGNTKVTITWSGLDNVDGSEGGGSGIDTGIDEDWENGPEYPLEPQKASK